MQESPTTSCTTHVKTGPCAATPAIHEKDTQLVQRVEDMPTIHESVPDVGQDQFRIFQAMQAVRCPAGCGNWPGTCTSFPTQDPALLDGPQGALISDQQKVVHESMRSLPPSFEPASEAGGSLVPSPFPPRPSEGGAGDQLVLRPPSRSKALTWTEGFELFQLYRDDPDSWTASKLASHFEVPEEWVVALLQHTWPPTYVEADGDVYGVYELRSFKQLR